MMLIDTHTHLYLPEFKEDMWAIFERAEEEGVSNFLLPAIDAGSHADLFRLEKEYPGRCHAMMGLHPCSVKENYLDELRVAREWFDKRAFIGVGEIGLDFYWDKTFIDQQYDALHQQLEWALAFDIPFSLHSRNATDECIDVVSGHQNGKLKGVFHCFSGDEKQAKQIIDLGLYLGIGGVVTFKNGGLDKVLEHVSLDHVVLETDAPYLAPVPFRGKRNEPAYLKYVVGRMAEIKKMSVEEVSEKISMNVEKIFGKL